MHLLAAQPGQISDGSEAIDLGQSPGDVIFLSSADTELAALAAAYDRLCPDFTLRLASPGRLAHPMSVDVYTEQTLAHARLVVVRLLGGRSYWPYGIDQIIETCRVRGIALVLLPGDDKADVALMSDSTLAEADVARLWHYCIYGGLDNYTNALLFMADLLGRGGDWLEPRPLPPAGIFAADAPPADDAPCAVVVFYRAIMLAGDLAPVESLLAALRRRGMVAGGIYVQSLKDTASAALVESVLGRARPDVIINLTGFAVATPGQGTASPLQAADCPVLQAVLAGSDVESWHSGSHGFAPRDIAMNVALPEVDGRVLAGVLSFKSAQRHAATQCDIAHHQPVADRVDQVADQAAAWARLRRQPVDQRRVAIILANYPNRDGRLGNGVGLDTPAGTIQTLRAMEQAGYGVTDCPTDGNDLLRRMGQGITNDLTELRGRHWRESLPLDQYQDFFATLSPAMQRAVIDRWGNPVADPFVLDGAFRLSWLRLGQVVVGVQPARGYNIDPAASYHDPALVPPHNYFAFYAWMRRQFDAHAVIHMGKHGNLEWLPGKSLALSRDCFPEAVFGPLPHLYPFIVNDPGEGTQAKRRAHAVIIDHLTPPLTRAETYGPLSELERLVDEYYDAAGVDPRRLVILRKEILALTSVAGLDRDLGISPDDDADQALAKLDNHLCELKELQIRDGLHIFGQSPQGDQRTDLLVALARINRGSQPGDMSLLRALADDLGLGFDPLDCVLGDEWTGPRPVALFNGPPWRTHGDTVERLELLARRLVDGAMTCPPGWLRTVAVLKQISEHLAPAVDGCGGAELGGLLLGLNGNFVPPGPSGAPTRGRPDVLPTGRNFYSVDTRTVPTPAAWSLGWKSAQMLVQRHLQDHGEWPKTLALTTWGTSTMRTGGDDLAQAMALLGVRPQWETASRRVIGFEILPVGVLDRPRVDVTLRVSGFFRDAFGDLINLFDSAVRAVAQLDESEYDNPLAVRVRADRQKLGEGRAAARIFGSMPGAYGAGLQALIDEKGWKSQSDLADAYVAWGGWTYGAGNDGTADHDLFRHRLSKVQAVVQNQDNREHDLLDSDDYYQFEGGMTAAVKQASGQSPVVYHPDHSRPESPRIHTLEEEIARIVRARVVNPKWIAGVMRHGYKGAFEMAATVDYLFAFAATTEAVKDHHFDLVADAYVADDQVRDFLQANNPHALAEIKARLREAIERGLWKPRRNSIFAILD